MTRLLVWPIGSAPRSPFVLVAVALLLVSSAAWGNGGPVASTDSSPQGGVFPIDEEKVALQEEELTLTIDADGAHYEAKANYSLANSGPARTIMYGVPVLAVDLEAARQVAKTISIAVAGKAVSCSIPDAKTTVSNPPLTAVLAAVSKYSAIGGLPDRSTWCVADVSIPEGAFVMTLTYQGQFIFEDTETSKSVLTDFGRRVLAYPLFPAGYWKGPVKTLSVRVAGGPFADHLTIEAPAGFVRQGNDFVLVQNHADLQAMTSLTAVVDVGPVLSSQRFARWNATGANRVMTAIRASSELKPEGKNAYGTAMLLDGKTNTAWCEGVPGLGIGEWLEVKADMAEMFPGCNFEGLALVPGYAKSATSWTENGRVRKISVRPCGKSSPVIVAELPVVDDPHAAGTFVELCPGVQSLGEPYLCSVRCLRVEIEDAIPGKKFDDTCMSELAVVVNCG